MYTRPPTLSHPSRKPYRETHLPCSLSFPPPLPVPPRPLYVFIKRSPNLCIDWRSPVFRIDSPCLSHLSLWGLDRPHIFLQSAVQSAISVLPFHHRLDLAGFPRDSPTRSVLFPLTLFFFLIHPVSQMGFFSHDRCCNFSYLRGSSLSLFVPLKNLVGWFPFTVLANVILGLRI